MIKSACAWLVDRHCGSSQPEGTSLLANDLLPFLAASWMTLGVSRHGPARKKLLRQAQVVQSASAGGATLLLNLPIRRGRQLADWIGDRLFYCPRGIPSTSIAAIASSRLKRPWDEQDNWFLALRSALRWSSNRQQTVLNVANTTTARFLQSCPEILDTQSWHIHLPRHKQGLEEWLVQLSQPGPRANAPAAWQSWMSPPLFESEPVPASLQEYPLQDRLIVAAADSLHLLQVRAGGNIASLHDQRLADAAGPGADAGIQIAIPADSAVSSRGLPGVFLAGSQDSAAVVACISDMAERLQEPFLAHWTRRCDGPWPGQAEREWIKQLILADPARQRSASCALERIILQQRIIASATAIRDSIPVVCLTGVPVQQWPGRRVYRCHRRRWDFLPYAIAIRRDWLVRRGARPVIYGDNSDWDNLPGSCRPFFQKSMSTLGKQPIDWSLEREWRVPGNVELADLNSEDGFLLVPDPEVARRLAPMSRWPVYFESASTTA